MLRNSLLILIFLISAFNVNAQFNNDWIDFSKSYYKIKVAETDFYRVTAEELGGAGFPVATIDPTRIQLFRKGVEQAINVVTTNNGSLQYLEFFGQGNDASSDAPLYSQASDQANQLRNLFSDSASYFLTYHLSTNNGRRIGFSSDNNTSGLAIETHHTESSIVFYSNKYSSGQQFGDGSSLSTYNEGEGWVSENLSKGNSLSLDVNLPNLANVSEEITIEVLLAGTNGNDHEVIISAGPSSTDISTIGSVQFSQRRNTKFFGTVPKTRVNSNGTLHIQVLAQGVDGQAENIAVAYINVNYPQETVINQNQNKIFQVETDGRKWLRLEKNANDNPRHYNISDSNIPVRLAASGLQDIVLPSGADKLISVNSPRSVGSIQKISLPNYSFENVNYLIITHESLRAGTDPVLRYKNYRESEIGGNHTVEILNIDDIYNLYGHGDFTPLAIKNAIGDAFSNNSLEFVFLIGKGYTVNEDIFRKSPTTLNIPTYGFPGGDFMFTLNLNTDEFTPGVPIGRLSVNTTQEVTNYLNKVIEHEAIPFNTLNRKDFLQLSGGRLPGELSSFERYIQEFEQIFTQDFIGGRAFNTGKQTSDVVEYIPIVEQINKGVGYVTFFGHSSGNGTDIEIGRVSDPALTYANKGKYPIFLVNGCQAGEIYGFSETFGEDWIATADLGAISFMAHSNIAYSRLLRRWSLLYHQVGFGSEFISKTVGEILVEVGKQFFELYSISNFNLAQVQQMQLQGDPSIRLFGADKPDYFIENTGISASGVKQDFILASQDSFKVDVIVKNLGRTVTDSINVTIERTLPDGVLKSFTKRFARVLRQDTLVFYIPNEPLDQNQGLNILKVRVDSENETEELDELNNIAQIELPIFDGSTVNLFPIDYAVVPQTNVSLIWQSSNTLESKRSYQLEVDTNSDFLSPNKQSYLIEGEVLLDQLVDLNVFSPTDTTTFFWRTRFADTQPEESNRWVTHTFTYIPSQSGWGQFTSDVIYSPDQAQGVIYNSSTEQLSFETITTAIEVFTFGDQNDQFEPEDLRLLIEGVNFLITDSQDNTPCISNGNTLNAIAFDKESGDPLNPILPDSPSIFDVLNDEICGLRPQRVFQFTHEMLTGSGRRLQVLLDELEEGDQILFFTIDSVSFENWDAPVIESLESVGISSITINELTNGQPAIFVGRKGASAGTALVLVNDGTNSPAREKSLLLDYDLPTSITTGKIISPQIGPAQNWGEIDISMDTSSTDFSLLQINGIDNKGDRSLIDEEALDASVYPRMILEYLFADATEETPPQLNFWKADFNLPPDGVLIPVSKEASQVNEGQEIIREFFFYNLSNTDFTDSLVVAATIIDENGGSEEQVFQIAPILAGDSASFQVSFPSFNKIGKNSIIVGVSANEQELYVINNRVTLTDIVEVEEDLTNPLLDVTFDGFHILNGDLVSPNPLISVLLKDENEFLFKEDTSGVVLELKGPGLESTYQRVNFTDPKLTFIPASENNDLELEYQPGPLEDGKYSLRVNAQDASGNSPGVATNINQPYTPYEIEFEVINESTVTHFYPYPNPFSTSCRFVFTLTGSDIPDEIKIQIMTVSGRVVREITQDELGALQIGNNITDYAWDGRDEFGDLLANGVYFYKVFIRNQGNDLKQRATSADQAFKNSFGKLYILR